jgi:hypothetical protein
VATVERDVQGAFFVVVPQIKPRASYMLGTSSTIELHPQLKVWVFFFFFL